MSEVVLVFTDGGAKPSGNCVSSAEAQTLSLFLSLRAMIVIACIVEPSSPFCVCNTSPVPNNSQSCSK